MKIKSQSKIIGTLLASAMILPITMTAAPKKVLVVSVTTGYRHASIPTMNKVIGQLGEQSKAFTVDYLEQPPGQPDKKDIEAYAKWEATLKEALAKLSPESLKNYDAVIFASTTGDLPIPDREGFLAWVKSGKGFIGLHAATDTFHGWPEFTEFIGGEFAAHGPQLSVSCINQDPQHPANKSLGKTFEITQEEMYQFNKHTPKNEHELLALDKKPVAADPQPGFYPVSWCHLYGKGRVFYTSLGHRDDIIDADPNLPDRVNSVEVSKAYQTHILGGILWALGLEPGDATPQAK
jgi:type 1 glutamine amidotransferase